MRVSRLLTIASAAVALTASPALAQSKAVPVAGAQPVGGLQPYQLGKWALMPMTQDYCQAIAPFEGGTYLSMGESEKGDGRVVVVDDGFSFTAGQPVAGTLSFDGWKTSTPVSFNPIKTGSGDWLAATETDASFMPSLGASKRLAVRIPSAQLDTVFDIPEAADLINEIHYCNARMAAR